MYLGAVLSLVVDFTAFLSHYVAEVVGFPKVAHLGGSTVEY